MHQRLIFYAMIKDSKATRFGITKVEPLCWICPRRRSNVRTGEPTEKSAAGMGQANLDTTVVSASFGA